MPIYKTVDTDFFKKWTPKMAYVLGFFCADGSMTKNKRGAYFIDLEITDRDLLEKIKKTFNSGHKMKKRMRHGLISYRLQIGSKEIFNDLLKLGLIPRKARRISLPKIPDSYFRHFVRGYFDGDGHVVVTQYVRKDRNNKKAKTILSGFTSCSEGFLKNLHNRLKRLAHIVGGSLSCSNGYHRLSFSVNDTLALHKFLYRRYDALCLLRKKKIFEEYFKMGS